MRLDLVVLDELGYPPFSQAGGALLFHLISKLYEHTSVVITTNVSFSKWPTMFEDEHGAPGSAIPPLSYRGDRQRVLPIQAQHPAAKTRIKARERPQRRPGCTGLGQTWKLPGSKRSTATEPNFSFARSWDNGWDNG